MRKTLSLQQKDKRQKETERKTSRERDNEKEVDEDTDREKGTETDKGRDREEHSGFAARCLGLGARERTEGEVDGGPSADK